METSGCVSPRSPHLQAISPSALKKWRLWRLDIKHAFLQAGTFKRDVFLHAPPEWNPSGPRRIWRLHAPAYGLNDAPVAFHRTLQKYLPNAPLSIELAGLEFQVSSFDPRLYFVRQKMVKPRARSPPILMIF